jgi:hypothetical protein
MFNEAFWFFYMVGIVGQLWVAFAVFLGVGGISILVVYAFIDDTLFGDERTEELIKLDKWARRWLVTAASIAIAAFFSPTEEALYAGAGQYVAESAELDETMLRLKKLVDKKIDELEQAE